MSLNWTVAFNALRSFHFIKSMLPLWKNKTIQFVSIQRNAQNLAVLKILSMLLWCTKISVHANIFRGYAIHKHLRLIVLGRWWKTNEIGLLSPRIARGWMDESTQPIFLSAEIYLHAKPQTIKFFKWLRQNRHPKLLKCLPFNYDVHI